MKARKTSEIYVIEGKDSSGLIPEKAISAMIHYTDEGDIKSIYYNIPTPTTLQNSSEDDYKQYDKNVRQSNSRKQTPEEMKQVVGLLKKLAQGVN